MRKSTALLFANEVQVHVELRGGMHELRPLLGSHRSASVDGGVLVRAPSRPGSRPGFGERAPSAPGPRVHTLRSGGLAQRLREGACARPLCRAEEALLRSRSLSPKRKVLLEARAARMRADMFPPEAVLWRALVNGKLGVAFRRQVVIAEYICDFVCASRRLVVEVDGAQHARRARADAGRDACLARLGYRVLRVEARVVLSEPMAALMCVRKATSGK